MIEDIARAIEDAAAAATKSVEKTKKKRRRVRESLLTRIAREDKVKAEILSAIKSRLTNKDKTLALAEIRQFATSLGMKEELAVRRNQAANQIVRHLATKSTEEIEAALHTTLPEHQPPGEEFGRWVELILGSDTKTGQPKNPDENG
ncbi:MAG: hypothetical protein OXH60_07765 [Rhodospirillales bacterium]|nr:hypothetical protein [Rhodospirillales bacterium]